MNVIELLDRIRYKPNCSFRVVRCGNEDHLFISLVVKDVAGLPLEKGEVRLYGPDMIEISVNRELPPPDQLAEFSDLGFCRHFIRPLIQQMELHEVDEWLKLNGTHVDDPHPLRAPMYEMKLAFQNLKRCFERLCTR